MSDNRQLGQGDSNTQDVNKTAESGQGVDQSRRKFSKTALVAAPVIMTLASQPVLGGSRRDCLSNMMSAHSGPVNTCDTTCRPEHSCKDWKTRPEKWSQAGCDSGKIEWVDEDASGVRKVSWGGTYATKCSDVFPFYSGSETMMDVLWKAEHDKTGYGFMASAITAYCNAKSDSTYGCTPNDVKDKCNKALGGTYENIYTKNGDDCVTALEKEFEYLNSEECGQESISFNCDDKVHWEPTDYDDCKEYHAFRHSDKWRLGTDKECKSLDEYRRDCKNKGSHGDWKQSVEDDSYKSRKGWDYVNRPWRRKG